MNLEFSNVGMMSKAGHRYMLQRADVTHNKRFWIAWRQIKKSLQKIICLRQEVVHGAARWYAYRMMPAELGVPFLKFSLTYSMRDTSGLLPYQPEAVRHICNSIIHHNAACDGSDTGLGKTYTALAVARELCFRPGIVCKKAGIATWKRALKHFGIHPLFVINWEKAKSKNFRYTTRSRDDYSGQYLYQWNVPDKTLLIFDEAHVAANHESQNYSLWLASRGNASISLSATFADRPKRLAGLVQILGIFNRQEYSDWLKKRGHFDNQHGELESLSSCNDMVELNRLLYPRYGFRLSYDMPQVKRFFPEAVYQTELVTMSRVKQEKHNQIYTKMVEKAQEYHLKGRQADVLVAELRYRQAAELLKAEAISELTDDYLYAGLSVCIFVNFRDTLSYLSKRLDTKSVIFGDQDKYGYYRESVIDRFQSGETRIIICMNEAGGQSISLHDLTGKHRRVSLICPTYNPIALKQVCGRTHRAGSRSTPIIKLVYSGGTIEEKVCSMVNEKIRNIDALNEGELTGENLFNLHKER